MICGKRKLVTFFVGYYMIQEILQQLQMFVFYNYQINNTFRVEATRLPDEKS